MRGTGVYPGQPVATYGIVALMNDSVAIQDLVRADLPHLRPEIDLGSMSGNERREAAAALRRALDLIERTPEA